jgi:hypothetical protein
MQIIKYSQLQDLLFLVILGKYREQSYYDVVLTRYIM